MSRLQRDFKVHGLSCYDTEVLLGLVFKRNGLSEYDNFQLLSLTICKVEGLPPRRKESKDLSLSLPTFWSLRATTYTKICLNVILILGC